MTRRITMKDHSNECHIIDIIVVQQQLEDLKLTGKLNIVDNSEFHTFLSLHHEKCRSFIFLNN